MLKVKTLNKTLDDFVPPAEFSLFFKEWQEEQKRIGMNYGKKSMNMFRECMCVGMLFGMSQTKGRVDDKEPVEAPVESTTPTRSRERKTETPVEEKPARSRERKREPQVEAPATNKRVRGPRTR